MRVGSLFAGIGGFDKGLEGAGMEVAWQVEIDDQARSVARRHWPDVTQHEDVTDVRPEELEPVDLVCGGFPCQDLSVAGRRGGLEGARSGLFWEIIRICSSLRPRWVLLENVPGLLSSNGGRDMGTVVGALGDIGYGWCFRVLDAQFFGLAQRRKRVFIAGCLGGEPRPEVLLEPEGLQGDSPPSREAGEEATRSLTSGSGGGRYDRQPHVAHPLTAREHKGPTSDVDGGNIVTVLRCPACGEQFSDPHAGTTGLAPTECPRCGEEDEVVIFNMRGREGGAMPEEAETASVRSASGGSSRSYVAFNNRQDHCPSGEVTNPKDNGGGVAFSINQRREGRLRDAHASLSAEPSGTQVDGVIHHGVRRLTPRECERLQGFPDDWTRYGHDGTEMADTPRYRMLGNAVAVPVAEWIGRRIMEASE